IAEQVALAKWDTGTPVEDLSREGQVIAAAVEKGKASGLDQASVSDFFRAQIEANKLVQYASLAEWRRAGRPPDHKAVNLAGTIRPELERVDTELVAELAATAGIRASASCRTDVANAVARFVSAHGKSVRPLTAIALDRALAAVCGADVPIENFEGRDSPAPWTLSTGPEFPGATGSLTLVTGYSGHGARLGYDLSHGGKYVGAFLSSPKPVTAAAVGFWVKYPANIRIRLRVTDSSGQTLQFNLSRPFGTDAGAWCQQVVSLDGPNSWWGGA